jgi:hypothetical protein
VDRVSGVDATAADPLLDAAASFPHNCSPMTVDNAASDFRDPIRAVSVFVLVPRLRYCWAPIGAPPANDLDLGYEEVLDHLTPLGIPRLCRARGSRERAFVDLALSRKVDLLAPPLAPQSVWDFSNKASELERSSRLGVSWANAV